MQKIIPFLWFKDNAEEAMNLYTATFKDAKQLSAHYSGDVLPGEAGKLFSATFSLAGQEFYVLNGNPSFPFTPIVSFYVDCETAEEVDALWQKLIVGGSALMELNKYPFSEKFGWVQDKFGISWQLNLTGAQQKITPLIMYTNEHKGQTDEAIQFYSSLFPNSKTLMIARYGTGEGGVEGGIKHAAFSLDGEEFKAMDSYADHAFPFTIAISFFVSCATQEQVDFLWEKLSEGGHKDQCGWLTDKYGVTWQIVPPKFEELIYNADPAKAKRAMQAMMKMTKLDINALQAAVDQA